MDRVTERVTVARKALATLEEALSAPKTPLARDAAIERFEYSFETVWKAAQNYLSEFEHLSLGSPASVIRGCFQTQLLSEDQSRTALRMARDRNLTVHTYNESLAEEIYGRLGEHARLMEQWLAALEARLDPASR